MELEGGRGRSDEQAREVFAALDYAEAVRLQQMIWRLGQGEERRTPAPMRA